MARRSLAERNIRTLRTVNGNYLVSIPIEYIRELGWREQQKITVEKKGKELIIKDWEKK